MKKLIAAVVAFVLACGAQDMEPVELGTATQPLYLPFHYGMEVNDGMRCDDDWDGGTCLVANSRSAKIYIVPGCPTWYKIRIQNAIIDMHNYVSALGWSVQQVGINDPFTHQIACELGNSKPMAYSWFSSNQTCQSTTKGTLCKTKGGFIRVKTEYIDNKPIFQNATETQRRAIVANSIRHEIGHVVFNLGHLPGTQGGTKLMAKGYPDDLSSDAWNLFLYPDYDEWNWLDCFNPGSGGAAC